MVVASARCDRIGAEGFAIISAEESHNSDIKRA